MKRSLLSKRNGQDRFRAENPSTRGSRLLSRSPDRSSPTPPLQPIARLQKAGGDRAISQPIQPGQAAKLTVSEPGDPLELEADRTAERVVHVSAGEVRATRPTATIAFQRKCTSCEEEERILRRHAAGPRMMTTAPAIVHEALSSPGQPLDAETRQFMEPRFGHDFSRVRVHVDDSATDSVNAHAFTVGHRIVFKTNQYRPGSESGRRLLAHELTHVVQQGAIDGASSSLGGAVLARKPVAQQASGLLPPEKVQGVYGDWVQNLFKVRNTTVMTEALDKDVRKNVKRQVGPGNFVNWERWEQAQQAKIDAQAEAENPKSNDKKLLNPQAELLRRHDQMWTDAQRLHSEIVRVEHLAQKLNFGSGVKGTMARITAGGYANMWGIHARAINSVVEHAPMFVLGAAGLVLGSELAERTLVNQGRAVKQEAEEMGEDARTADRLVDGDLQAAYQETRPSYNKYRKVFRDIIDTSMKFKKDLQLDGIDGYVAQAKDITDMAAAMKAMREARNEYLMTCAKMGVETDAQALDKMGSHTFRGLQDTVGTAVTMVLPEVAPGLGELKSAFKGAEGMGAKQLEKAAADEVAASIAEGAASTSKPLGTVAEAAGATRAGASPLTAIDFPHGSPANDGSVGLGSRAARRPPEPIIIEHQIPHNDRLPPSESLAATGTADPIRATKPRPDLTVIPGDRSGEAIVASASRPPGKVPTGNVPSVPSASEGAHIGSGEVATPVTRTTGSRVAEPLSPIATPAVPRKRISLATSMEQGLVRAGGNNEKILREIEFGFAEATPTNAEEAHNLVKYAAAEVQLIPGEPKVAADGTIILMNLGVMTTLGLDGSILVTRGNDVLLYLIP